MDICLVRLEPYDPRCGRVLRRYTYRGIRFQEACGWYRVSAEVAEYLGTVRQVAGDVRTPLAFEIRWPEEAQVSAVSIEEPASPYQAALAEDVVLKAASSSRIAESEATAPETVSLSRTVETAATDLVAASAGRALEIGVPAHEAGSSYRASTSDDIVLAAAPHHHAGDRGERYTPSAFDGLMPEEPLAFPAAGGDVPDGPEETSSPSARSYDVLAALPEIAVPLSVLEEASPPGDERYGADGLINHAAAERAAGDGGDQDDQAIEPLVAAIRARHVDWPERQEPSGGLFAPGCALPGSGRSSRSPPLPYRQLTHAQPSSARLRAPTRAPCGPWGDARAPP